MKDKIHEQLSALLDDELADAEQSLLVRQLVKESGLREQLSHYQVVSDALHDKLPQQIDTRFHERVHAAVQQEAAINAAPSRYRALLRPLAGLAAAASVAVVAVVSLQTMHQQDPAATPSVATAPTVDSYIRAENAPTPVVPARGLDVYLVNHNEYAVNRGMQGMLPYVRIVGQDMRPEDSREAE
ncbi:MAG: sigma-E factor negative regulatory protein [Gammaproteobacteria bacterium]|nr:sigma-E factor negative regulatory protein [Gammaproteobacteria bacterium]